MIKVIVEHKVKNFDTWKPVFESSFDLMNKHGITNASAGLLHGSTNHVYVTCDADTEKNARAFTSSEELKKKMQESGVISEPKIIFLKELDRG